MFHAVSFEEANKLREFMKKQKGYKEEAGKHGVILPGFHGKGPYTHPRHVEHATYCTKAKFKTGFNRKKNIIELFLTVSAHTFGEHTHPSSYNSKQKFYAFIKV
jgi:hypothetical protein